MMEDEAWLMQQNSAWRDGQEAMREDEVRALSAALQGQHRRDTRQRRVAYLAMSAGGIFLSVIAAPMLWLRGQHVIAALSLLNIPLIAYAIARMEQGWRVKQAALALPPGQIVRALGEQLSAREVEMVWGQRLIKVKIVFTLVLGVAAWSYAPKVVAVAVLAALLIYAVLTYMLHVSAPRALAAERARYEALLSELSDDHMR